MAKKVQNGDENGQTTIVIQQKAMGMQEKGRIEKLIDQRASDLNSYLEELKSFAMEANAEIEDEYCEQKSKLNSDIALLTENRLELDTKRDSEYEAVSTVLHDELEEKVKILNQQIKNLKDECKIHLDAAKQDIHKKYENQRDKINSQLEKLRLQLDEIKAQENKTRMLRKLTLSNSFSALRDAIKDRRNKAVEGLYTEAITSDQAKKHLNLLPDNCLFREHVKPEAMFRIFDATIKAKALNSIELVCVSCGKENFSMTGDTYYCRHCGRYNCLSRDVKELTALPTLDEIMNQDYSTLKIENKTVVVESQSSITDEAV